MLCAQGLIQSWINIADDRSFFRCPSSLFNLKRSNLRLLNNYRACALLLSLRKLGIWVDDLIIGRWWGNHNGTVGRFLRQSRLEAIKVKRIIWGSTGILRRWGLEVETWERYKLFLGDELLLGGWKLQYLLSWLRRRWCVGIFIRDLFDLALLAAFCRVCPDLSSCSILTSFSNFTIGRLVLLLGGLSGVRGTSDGVFHCLIETLLIFFLCWRSTWCTWELLEAIASVHTASGHGTLLFLMIKDHVGFFLVRLAHGCKVKVC